VHCFSDQLTDDIIFYLIRTEKCTFSDVKVAKIYEIRQNVNVYSFLEQFLVLDLK
jgi:hypothetical protein